MSPFLPRIANQTGQTRLDNEVAERRRVEDDRRRSDRARDNLMMSMARELREDRGRGSGSGRRRRDATPDDDDDDLSDLGGDGANDSPSAGR